MFINDRTYFNHILSTEDAKSLLENLQQAIKLNNNAAKAKLYNSVVKNMKLRVVDNYLSPAKYLMKYSNASEIAVNSGFILMSINCILIEFYFEMINGYDVSNEAGKRVKDAYTSVLPLIDKDITKKLSEIFYSGIRCGIMHQGQTKNNTAITYEYNVVMEENGGIYLSNPITLFNGISELYSDYWAMISRKSCDDKAGANLCKKFELILMHIEECLVNS